MKLRLRQFALCALLVAPLACDQPGTTVRVDLDAPGVTLTSLSLDVTLASGPHQHKDLATKVPVEVLLLLADVATQVTVTVSGADTAGDTFTVTKSIDSVVNQQVELSFALGPNAPMDGGADLGDGSTGDLPPPDLMPSQLTLLAGAVGGDGDADGALDRARLFQPQGLALSGNTLYVLEGQSGQLRKLDVTTNTVSSVPLTDSVTGNPFTFSFGVGLVYDGAGTLYASSSYDSTIHKIAAATGQVTLVAGSPSGMGSADGNGSAAAFWNPSGLALDGAGNLWVADATNGTIRKIVLGATNTVSTPAGVAGMLGFVDGAGGAAGPARFTAPQGLVFYAGDLYVTDGYNGNASMNNRALRKIVVTSNPVVVSTIVGTAGMTPMDRDGALATSGFGNPVGVAVDGSGTFYVADQGDDHVRKVVTGAGGTVSVLAGNASSASGWADAAIGLQALFENPLFLAVDAGGQSLFASDASVIRRISLAGMNPVTTLAGLPSNADEVQGVGAAARFDTPQGVTFDGTDTLYVADRNSGTIRKVTLSTGDVAAVAGGGPQPESTDGIDGNATFGYPAHLAVDAANAALYVADSDTHLLRKVVIAGGHATVTTVAGKRNMSGSTNGPGTTMALLNGPWGVAFDGAHTVFIADAGNNLIRAFDTTTGMVSTVAGSGNFGDKNDIGTLAEFRTPRGLAFDGAKNILYVSELWGQCVRQVQLPGGAVTNVVGQIGNSGHTDGTVINATFRYPDGLALDPSGRVLYIADEGNDLVRRFDLQAGMVDTPAGEWNQEATTPGPLPARVHSPFGLAWTPRGLVITSPPENALLLMH
ncbi:MAG TPA: NHL repeat-containing protein [Polyangia bacterium]|nr:NHL repeat-containing protein [Polyangia bacterium]